ncbi:MAG: hypothetical protein FWE55_02230 [Synergistaceae bacterium]|nr:hypothetical protein [Synergistaceae bacterium]
MDELRKEMKILGLMKAILDEVDDERRVYLADKILDIDPDNAIGKYVKWQSSNEPATIADTKLLEEAIDSLRTGMGTASDSSEKDKLARLIYISMLTDLVSFSYIKGDKSLAYEVASEFMRVGGNDNRIVRTVYYASLLERGDFEEMIRATESDILENSSAYHCRAIAAFELDGRGEMAARSLMDAIALDPDLPYYILGVWGFDDEAFIETLNCEDVPRLEDIMITVPILHELWSANEERLEFLATMAFAFGYITGRVEPDDMKMVENGCRNIECLEEIREARDIIHAMLAAGREQDEVDEKALSIFEENDYFGLSD